MVRIISIGLVIRSCLSWGCLSWAAAMAEEPLVPAPPIALPEVLIEAPEPRYVAPTRRDRIGRIWAPVYINDKGPFRFVLDTGASSSAAIASVAEVLGIALDHSSPVMLRGVTGNATVPVLHVETLLVGDVLLNGKRLPIVPDALGGAEGILGSEGLTDRRIVIDFVHDRISILRSHNESGAAGFITLPVTLMRGRLLTVNAMIGTVRVKAIIDTGGQVTIANLALRDALQRGHRRTAPTKDSIVGATMDVEFGEGYVAPQITLGNIVVKTSHMTFGDVNIFRHWKLTDTPAVLIGMDVLGLLDTLIIDYRRKELQIRLRHDAS